MDHAKLNASSGERWLACPGSVEANAHKGRRDNKYSLEGTSAHGLLEVCMLTGCPPEDFFGKTLKKGHMPVDQDMVDGVGHALDWVAGYCANHPNAHVYIERRVHYGESIGCDDDDAFGHPDIQIDNWPAELVTIDYKHGMGIAVSVKDNVQLRLYHVGKRQERDKRYRRYRSVVIQPRLRGRRPVQEHSYSDKEITDWLTKKVIPIVPVALGKNAPRVAGRHCRYCAASGNCPAQYQEVLRLASKEFSVDPKALTPAQLGKLLDTFEFLDIVREAVNKRAVVAVHAGVDVPGWEKSWTSPHRAWTDEDKANALLTKLGLETKERYAVKLLTPAQAEAALKGKKLWPKKQRGVEETFTPLDKVVMRPEPGPSIRRAAK